MIESLITKVEQWAEDKGILSKATPIKQAYKTQEELNELIESLMAQQNNLQEFVNSKGYLVNTQEEIKDAIGDILVTVIIQARMQNLKIEDCLESAYNVISKRTGKLIDGQFVKDK